jgi:hypothetical protein
VDLSTLSDGEKMRNNAPRIVEAVVDKARQLVGGLALTAAFMASTAPADAAHAKHEKLDGIQFVQPDQLPGHNIGVPARAGSLLADASVKVYATPIEEEPGYPIAPTALCSGVKVGVGNHTYISLAGHCFESETLSETGVLDPFAFPANNGALDFFNRAHYTYNIEDPAVPLVDRQSLATADGIDVSTDTVDAALLKVIPNVPEVGKTGLTGLRYQQLPAVPYLRQANLIPGQKVALYSTPESTDNEPVESTGTYIGVDQEWTGYGGSEVAATRPVDVVLIHPKQPYQDACYYGASGSEFAAQESSYSNTGKRSKKIVESGPLSGRINSLYDPYLDPPASNVNPEIQLKESLQEERGWRTEVELQLGVAISPKDTICEYSVVGNNTKNALVHAFGNFAPPLPVKGGGGEIGDK